MEKTWKKASAYEYERCFNILNTPALTDRNTYVKFAVQLFEIAKRQLGVDNAQLKFVEQMGNNLGVSTVLDHSVTLNLEKMDKQNFFKTVSTIYHELTHLKQDLVATKKKVDTAPPAEFPFVHCFGSEAFLPRETLGGISPFLFYYTCQVEKEARDVGSECAMDLFLELQKISQTKFTLGGASRLIDRCISQTQERWDRENADNEMASSQIKEFMKIYPDFQHQAFERIKQEYLNDYKKFGLVSKERLQCEDRFHRRVGSLVLMGCDDKLKNDILSFAATNFIGVGNVFNTMISVIDSPYSRVTKNDFTTLFQYADKVKCTKDVLFNYLTNWDRKYVDEVVNGGSSQKVHFTFNGIDYEL